MEFISENASAYIAHETRGIAKSLVVKPTNTPVCSPQSMANSFVNIFMCDYMSEPHKSARCVAGVSAIAFEHLNEIHLHLSLKMMSPGEFRRRADHTVHQG